MLHAPPDPSTRKARKKSRANAVPGSRAGPARRPVTRTSSLELLAEAAKDLNSSLNLQEVFQKVAERIKPLIDYHLFCVMLWNEHTRLLEHSYSLRFGEHLEQKGGFPLGFGISGSAGSLRQALRIPDVRADLRYVRYRHPEVEIRSELAVPLLVKDRLIGVLDLESTRYDYFTREHEQLLTALGSHIASALDNARLYEEMLFKERRLEEDLITAREIQKGLLPGAAPRVDGLDIGVAYLPAAELGGDFYDFLACEDGRLAVAVGDVAGKATAAALYGSLAVGILRGHVIEHSCSPARMLAHMNEQLFQTRIHNRYVAMAYGLYDRRDRTMTLSNAGFPRPRLVRSGRCEKVPVEGVPLGLLPGMKYAERTLSIEAGDLIAFVSDGLEECSEESRSIFGGGRLGDQLCDRAAQSATEIARGLLRGATRHLAPGVTCPDDCTAVVVKFV